MEREQLLVAELLGKLSFPSDVLPSTAFSLRGRSILNRPPAPEPSRGKMEVHKFSDEDEPRVVEFLNREPLKNVVMLGFIRDHGMAGERLRGTFYGCSSGGALVGVGLIGYWVILGGSVEAAPAFARVARLSHQREIRIMLGEEKTAEAFHQNFTAPKGNAVVVESTESHLLFTAREMREDTPAMAGLRPAVADDAEELIPAHAHAVFEDSGTDPLAQEDVAGFRQRVLERAKSGRTWIVQDGETLTFKADIASETDEAAYLEAIWTRPDRRGKGLGSAALKALCRQLLTHHQAVCLFAKATEPRLVSFYRRVGFELLSTYRIFRYASSES